MPESRVCSSIVGGEVDTETENSGGVVDVGDGINGVFNGVVNDLFGVCVNEINPEILLNQTPPIGDVDTPNITLSSDGVGTYTSLCGSDTDSQSSQNGISANDLLKNIRIKNVNRLIVGTLNINFIAPKFEQLKEVIGNHLDIFTIQETKIDKSFPEDQFEIEGLSLIHI